LSRNKHYEKYHSHGNRGGAHTADTIGADPSCHLALETSHCYPCYRSTEKKGFAKPTDILLPSFCHPPTVFSGRTGLADPVIVLDILNDNASH
jgi:hypothetical protein